MMEEESTSHATEDSYTSDRIKLNVGGKLFETTLSTIRSGGQDSLLFALSNRRSNDSNPVFIDRDPEIFSVLLSLLRTNHLPSTARRFTKQELADEALFYGIDTHLRSATAPPPFSGIDATVVCSIRPASEGLPSTFSATDNGAVWIAHGGQVSSYDHNLIHAGTIRTHLDEVGSICKVWQEIAAVGSESDAGLHFYNFSGNRHVGSINWSDPSDPRIFKARVYAVTPSESSVFASFDCPHKENCILEVNKEKLQIVSQLGRQSGNQAKHKVPGKLTWIPATGVLLGTAITGGAFGYSGYIRLWDPRSGEVVWETNEPGSGRSSRFGDSFADVDADVERLLLFKLCSKSGDLAMADMRFLKDDPWIYLKEKNPSLVSYSGGGRSSVVHCYGGQVFVARDGELEVWSRVQGWESGGVSFGSESESNAEGFYRRNFVDKREDSERGIIKKIEGGGDRLFVSREDVEGIEVWESSLSPGAISVL